MHVNRMLVVAAMVVLLTAVARAQALRPVVGVDTVRVVGPTDTLYSLAHAARLGLEHVVTSNALPMRMEIPLGTVVTLPTRRILPARPPANGIVLNVPERGIYFFLGGRFVQFFPVAVGRLGFLTPRGSFRVIEKIKDPTWYPPVWADERAPVGPGDKNPLGDRWIGTSATRVGIHGTQSPYSIGMCISHGCIRMYPDHVRALFDQVWLGMPVRIEYETAKLGVDGRTGTVYLATFPDVYRLREPYEEAMRKVREAGLLGRVSPRAVRERASARFRAVALWGSDFVVRVDGQRLPLPIDPIVRGRLLWLPAEFLGALGLRVAQEERRTMLVARGDDEMRLSVRDGLPPLQVSEALPGARLDGPSGPVQRVVTGSGDIASTACRWQGRLYVRADEVLDFFEMRHEWRVAERTLVVSTPNGVRCVNGGVPAPRPAGEP